MTNSQSQQRTTTLGNIALWALFTIHHVRAEPLTVSWGLRSNGANFKANTQDSVMLDWNSDAPTPVLRMLCQNETVGGNAVIVSSFGVDTNGPFEYIMDSYVEPGTMNFPRTCFPELSQDENGTNGIECPIGIEWSFDESLPAKTVSQADDVPPETTTAASRSSTTTPNGSTSSPSQTTTDPTSGTDQPNASSTGGSAKDSAATTAPAASTPSSTNAGANDAAADNTAANNVGTNNTGVIVGGVIGGVAVLSLIIFGFFFLRRQRLNSAFPPTNEPSKWRASFFGRGPKEPMPVFEKDGSGIIRELEGSGMAREMEAGGMERGLEANAGDVKANRTVPYYSMFYKSRSPVELPASSNYYS
ncbi:hypothetical protein V490_01460 [Pseudogymnoascus sp. VKM F-3557]|nr:hypothetical protein V490_01460 [Pseudogymnoascus sp. VKM F-3557]